MSNNGNNAQSTVWGGGMTYGGATFGQQPQQLLGSGVMPPPAYQKPRRFNWGSHQPFKDTPESMGMSIEEVQESLASIWPGIKHATYEISDDDPEFTDVTFYKTTGEKGSLTAAQVAKIIAGLTPTKIEAFDLLAQLNSTPPEKLTARALLNMAPQIEVALAQLKPLQEASEGVVQRCLTLRAVHTTRHIPLGF